MKIISCFHQPADNKPVVCFETIDKTKIVRSKSHRPSLASIKRLAILIDTKNIKARPFLGGLVGFVAIVEKEVVK